MRRTFIPLVIVLSLTLPVVAQDAEADRERESVRRVVETYLYSEEPEERKRTLYPQAKILSVDPTGSKVVETPVPKPAKKMPGRVRVISRQKIVSIDLADDGACVKVETDLSSDDRKVPKHIHYLSLLKLGGEWKIVGILMPTGKTFGPPK